MVHMGHRLPILLNCWANEESWQAFQGQVREAKQHDRRVDQGREAEKVPPEAERTLVWHGWSSWLHKTSRHPCRPTSQQSAYIRLATPAASATHPSIPRRRTWSDRQHPYVPQTSHALEEHRRLASLPVSRCLDLCLNTHHLSRWAGPWPQTRPRYAKNAHYWVHLWRIEHVCPIGSLSDNVYGDAKNEKNCFKEQFRQEPIQWHPDELDREHPNCSWLYDWLQLCSRCDGPLCWESHRLESRVPIFLHIEDLAVCLHLSGLHNLDEGIYHLPKLSQRDIWEDRAEEEKSPIEGWKTEAKDALRAGNKWRNWRNTKPSPQWRR